MRLQQALIHRCYNLVVINLVTTCYIEETCRPYYRAVGDHLWQVWCRSKPCYKMPITPSKLVNNCEQADVGTSWWNRLCKNTDAGMYNNLCLFTCVEANVLRTELLHGGHCRELGYEFFTHGNVGEVNVYIDVNIDVNIGHWHSLTQTNLLLILYIK